MKTLATIIVALAISLGSVTAAYGADEEPGSFDPGTAAVMLEETIRNTYEVSVLEQIAGRCGMTETGAKGIVFEILAKDKINLKNLFNKDYTSRLALSPNSPRADLVAVNSSGKVIDFYQCKNATSESGIRNIFNQVRNGKYPWTKLIGTSETAQEYNAFAAANGSSSTMIDSGISSETTTRIADKALGHGLDLSSATSVGLKTGALGAGVNAIASLVDCIIHQRSFTESVGKVSVQSIKGFVCGFGTGYLVEITGAALAAAGAGTVSLIIVPAAVSVGAGIVACYILDKAIDISDIEAKVAELTTVFGDKVHAAVEKGKELVAITADYIGNVADNVSNSVTEDILPAIRGTIDKAVGITRTGMVKLGLSTK